MCNVSLHHKCPLITTESESCRGEEELRIVKLEVEQHELSQFRSGLEHNLTLLLRGGHIVPPPAVFRV